MLRRLVFALVLVLAGCARFGAPAPFELHTHAGETTLSQPLGPHPDRVTVAGGDTLYGLSRRYGVPMRAIIDANGLGPPYRLAAGSALTLPQVRTHEVQPGDTLTAVARHYGVEASTLAATNHLEPPYAVRRGEVLVLPAPVEIATVAAAPQPPVAATAAAPPPVTATVLSAPVATAPLPAPPSPAPTPEAAVPPAETPPPVSPPPQTATLTPPAAPVPPGAGFVWPVQGRILSAFGAGPEGTHNDGINIAAPVGTPVLAAAAGEVAYAGNELRGYGNLILIKHADGFVTAYAHNETLMVKRGERVRRGQPIAKVGATGAVNEPQLHFEIRRGARVLDPGQYLPAQAATARS